MPAGLDEAAAIVAFISIAFNLLKTLTTYAADVKEAEASLQDLRIDLEYILAMSQEHAKILRKNEKTRVLRGSDLIAARQCRDKAERVVNKLQALSRKAGAASARGGAEVQWRMALPRRMIWPVFKPQVEEVRRDVRDTRSSHQDTRNLYNAAAW
ncbi:hypothetical protein LTR85_008853 [Meristemomyces frigidus]|nr:hypothetical protein LTR85_008853 [Meristemomyces frigidus]